MATFSEFPVSHGGFSDIYRGRLSNDTQVAIKALRICADSISQNPKHLKVSGFDMPKSVMTSQASNLARSSRASHME
jgi:hypothetical protein